MDHMSTALSSLRQEGNMPSEGGCQARAAQCQGGGNIMHARALDYAMHNYAQLCRMHFDEDTRGLQKKGGRGS